MKINIKKSTDFYLEGHMYDYPAYHFNLGDLHISCIPLNMNGKIYYLANHVDENRNIIMNELVKMKDSKPIHAAYTGAFNIIQFYMDCTVESFELQED